MARKTEKIILMGSVFTPADISTAHRFMSATTQGVLCSSSGEAVHGVLNEPASGGEMTAVAEIGHALVEAGAVVAVGAEVQSDASARAITLAGGQKAGRALSAATSAGELIVVRIPA